MVQVYKLERESVQWKPYLPALMGEYLGDRFGFATDLVEASHALAPFEHTFYASQSVLRTTPSREVMSKFSLPIIWHLGHKWASSWKFIGNQLYR